MKQAILCVFGDGYTEPNNCAVELAPEERMLVPAIGDEVELPGMKAPQVVRSCNFCYSEKRILIILNEAKIRSAEGQGQGFAPHSLARLARKSGILQAKTRHRRDYRDF